VGYIAVCSYALREARLRGAPPLVVGGWSKKYEYQPGLSVLSVKSFGGILRRDQGLYEELKASPLVEPSVLEAFVAMEDVRQLISGDRAGESGGPPLRVIHLPDYVDWDYRNIAGTLEAELAWRRPEDRGEAHFDCRLAPLQEYIKVRRFGFGQMTIKNSVLVREGRMSREEALRRAALEQDTPPEVLPIALREWDMTQQDVAWDAEWAG
jgi:hypothetical protein